MNKNDKKKEISFKPKARLIIQVGDRLIANEKIAISEVIKNSYDADARNVIVEMNDIDDLEKGEIIILDDGKGMNLDIIENVWMEPGTNFKEDLINNLNKSEFQRTPIGEKGIGRFGVHKLGNKIELISKRKNEKEVKLSIDWNKFDTDKYLDEEKISVIEKQDDSNNFFGKNEHGTYLRISSLRKKWTKTDFRTFYRNAISLVSPFDSKDDFFIEVKSNLDWEHGLIKLREIKRQSLWYFKIKTRDSKIEEFEYVFKPYEYMDKLSKKIITEEDDYIKLDTRIQRKIDKEFKLISSEGFGDLTIEGYIFDFDKNTLDLSEITDRKGIKDYVKENGGIRVYRDGMRIYDYGEAGNDWLGLDQARINAPTLKIGNKQILCSVSLSREMSRGLEEQTNREGFIENDTFYNFRDSIVFLLNKVNFLRNIDKDKIKQVYQKEVDIEESTISIINKLEKKINKKDVVPIDDDRNFILNNLKKIEINYTEMKNTLLKSAGSGLAYSLVIHEIEKMIYELKDRTSRTNNSELKSLTEKLGNTIESITNLFVNSKMTIHKLETVLDKSMKFFKYRVETHNIELIKSYQGKNIKIECSDNFLINAIMNLVDNSIYWFKYHEKRLKDENKPRKILVDIIELEDDKVGILVADTGFGFSIDAETAVLPFKTTKIAGDGIGLGLYYVNEIMKMHKGNIRIMKSKKEIDSLNIRSEFNGAIVILEFDKVSE